MEKKKNSRANTENLRLPIVLASLLFVGGLVLASFSYSTNMELDNKFVSKENAVDIVFIQKEKEVKPPVEQPEQTVIQPPAQIIIIDSNKTVLPPIVVAPPPPPLPPGPPVVVVVPPVVKFPDVDARFPGGPAAMQKWIGENLEYPASSIRMIEQGKVYITFVVEVDGSITNIKVVREIADALDKEAKRVTRQMPNWEPGEVKGKRVRTQCRIPYIFVLN